MVQRRASGYGSFKRADCCVTCEDNCIRTTGLHTLNRLHGALRTRPPLASADCMTSRKQFAFSNSPPNQKSRDTCSRFERAATTSLEATVAGFHLGCRLPPRPSLAGVDCGAEVTTSRELRTCRKSPSNCTGRDTCSRFAQASTKALEVAAVNFHLTCRPCPDSSR